MAYLVRYTSARLLLTAYKTALKFTMLSLGVERQPSQDKTIRISLCRRLEQRINCELVCILIFLTYSLHKTTPNVLHENQVLDFSLFYLSHLLKVQ